MPASQAGRHNLMGQFQAARWGATGITRKSLFGSVCWAYSVVHL
jgi:hypothetical protein